jgi:hypothetical protein
MLQVRKLFAAFSPQPDGTTVEMNFHIVALRNPFVTVAIVVWLVVLPSWAADQPERPSFEPYLRESAVPKETIDRFLRGPTWAQYDPELGYILSNYRPADGMDDSSTISTVQTNGARTSFVYADHPCRINTYGDSFTQCHQVSDAETWQEYLAGHLGEPIRKSSTAAISDTTRRSLIS